MNVDIILRGAPHLTDSKAVPLDSPVSPITSNDLTGHEYSIPIPRIQTARR